MREAPHIIIQRETERQSAREREIRNPKIKRMDAEEVGAQPTVDQVAAGDPKEKKKEDLSTESPVTDESVLTSSPSQSLAEGLQGVAHRTSTGDDANPTPPPPLMSPSSTPFVPVQGSSSATALSAVDYPHLVSTLQKSKVYGASASAPPETPDTSTVSSSDEPLQELNQYAKGEEAMDACPFCLRMVYPAEETITRLPCCGFVLHEVCYRKKGWHHMPAELKCPDCSRPPILTVDYSKEIEPPDIEDRQTFASKMRVLVRKRGVTTGLRQIYNALKSGQGINSVPQVTKEEVIRSKLNLNDLLTAGFSLDTIHDSMGVKSWDDLKALGFNEDQLPKLEDHVNSLVRLYGVDATRLRRDMRLTLKKLASLRLRSTTLRDLGFDAQEFCYMGLQKSSIKWFDNLTMANWVDHFNFAKTHLGILKITRNDFDSIQCLAPVSWNAEALREKLKISVDNAIQIRLISASDLERRERAQKFTVGSSSPSGNKNRRGGGGGGGGGRNSPRLGFLAHGYEGFRTPRPPQNQNHRLPGPPPLQQQQPVLPRPPHAVSAAYPQQMYQVTHDGNLVPLARSFVRGSAYPPHPPQQQHQQQHHHPHPYYPAQPPAHWRPAAYSQPPGPQYHPHHRGYHHQGIAAQAPRSYPRPAPQPTQMKGTPVKNRGYRTSMRAGKFS